MQPIETIYRSVKFRSRLEARWAMFFDEMEWPWSYETKTVTLPSGDSYTPDFHLERQSVFVEIKPTEPTGWEILKMKAAQPIVLLIGVPDFRDYWYLKDGDEKLLLMDQEWAAAPMDRKVDASDFGPRYHAAVQKANEARFDGFDTDRDKINKRYS